jgi:predicted ribosomally synthesized peptide with SipW-like signal peptide
MRPPPPPSQLPRYPVVGGLALLAVAVTLAYWSQRVDIGPLEENVMLRHGQWWRLVTTILPHGDPMHLVFNVYWLWVFGTVVEEEFGHARTLGMILLFAFGSSAADYALAYGGIGLSGVGYGLFGLLWVLSRYHPRFRGVVDQNTVVLFTAWFFLCIVLTYTGAMHVANVAHGAGALLGVALGLAIARPRQRPLWGAVLALFVSASAAAAAYGRQYVNLTKARGEELAQVGLEDLVARRNEKAASHLDEAVRVDDQQAWAWFNLGVARERLGQDAEAERAFGRAADLQPGNPEYRRAAGRAVQNAQPGGETESE